jgi:hypothetical protein
MAVFVAQPVQAQEVLIHLRRQGDTLSIKNAPVTIDHVIESKTDDKGIARIEGVEDGGHIIEATAPGYLVLFDQFDVGPDIKQPIEVEMIPNTGKTTTGPTVNSAPPPGGQPTP